VEIYTEKMHTTIINMDRATIDLEPKYLYRKNAHDSN